ncbi:MAG TPA: sulfurtransferase [Pseudorhodoferax sp.]|nr:sulfurtransferase [Pseudorhodoferax sp.]
MSPLISCAELSELCRANPAAVLVVDCSFDLADPSAGRRAFDAQHIAGAAYLHLEDALSGPRTGDNGRHPLPDLEAFAQAMRSVGAHDDTLVVACDSADGRYAARLWWMLRWAGHARVRVLDGGLRRWRQAGLPLESGRQMDSQVARQPGGFAPRRTLERVATYEDVRANLQTQARILLDARARARFQGQNETLDPVAGHIPGARNRPYRDNLTPEGLLRAPTALRAEFDVLLAGRPADDVIHQCGSGVTSCHNRLAMEVAGFQGAWMYVGSWSEWIARPDSPIATGMA